MILSLIWQLIQSFSTENREEGVEKAVERMVEWGKKKAGRVGVDVYNLCGCFEGGLGFGAVLKGVSESFPWEECVFGDVGPAGLREFFFFFYLFIYLFIYLFEIYSQIT